MCVNNNVAAVLMPNLDDVILSFHPAIIATVC